MKSACLNCTAFFWSCKRKRVYPLSRPPMRRATSSKDILRHNKQWLKILAEKILKDGVKERCQFTFVHTVSLWAWKSRFLLGTKPRNLILSAGLFLFLIEKCKSCVLFGLSFNELSSNHWIMKLICKKAPISRSLRLGTTTESDISSAIRKILPCSTNFGSYWQQF